jgi:cell division protease FtsH
MLEINDAVDRVVAGMEGTPLVDSKSKRLIAYHEVGHAIVGTVVKDHDPVQKVTLIPRGQAQGLTWFTPNEEQGLITRAQLKARITGALGGRAAEEEIFGDSEVTTGAGGDLQQVTSMARQMVTRFGMSDLGPMSLESQEGEVFLGGGLMSRAEYSEEIASRIDEQVRTIIEHCHDEARRIMRENRTVIDRLVDLLIEKETIDGEEFRQIVAEYREVPEKEQYVPVLLLQNDRETSKKKGQSSPYLFAGVSVHISPKNLVACKISYHSTQKISAPYTNFFQTLLIRTPQPPLQAMH